MPVNDTFHNALLDGANPITHIGLVDGTNTELTGGSYARLPVTWTAAAAGLVRPTGDLTFQIPAGATVSGWQGYSALTAGNAYGVVELDNEVYNNAGEYTLDSAQTSIDLNADPASA